MDVDGVGEIQAATPWSMNYTPHKQPYGHRNWIWQQENVCPTYGGPSRYQVLAGNLTGGAAWSVSEREAGLGAPADVEDPGGAAEHREEHRPGAGPEPALAPWPGGVHRKWVECGGGGGGGGATPCWFGGACTRAGCWYSHPPGHPLGAPRDAAARFTVLSWNCQAAATRGRGGGAADRRGAEACVRQILRDPRLRCPRVPHRPADLLALQELQRCPRQVARGDCLFCARDTCKYDHARWVSKTLEQAGYDGAVHQHGMTNTIGVFWRRDTFELPRRRAGSEQGTAFFVDFDRPYTVGGSIAGARATKKGAVLALLRHRPTGQRLLAVSAHPSVPLSSAGAASPETPLGEMRQLKKKVDVILGRNSDGAGCSIPWLIAGDLNSVPRATAGCAPPLVYDYLTGAACRLRSAYHTVLGREPPLTSVKSDFRHTIDYVLLSADLSARGVLDVTEGTGAEDRAAAMQDPWPSDHLPVMAEVLLPPPGQAAAPTQGRAVWGTGARPQ